MKIFTYSQLDKYKVWKSTFNFSCIWSDWKEYIFNCIKHSDWYIAESADILPKSWSNTTRSFRLKDKAIEYLKTLMREVWFKDTIDQDSITSNVSFEAQSSSMFDRSYSDNELVNRKIVWLLNEIINENKYIWSKKPYFSEIINKYNTSDFNEFSIWEIKELYSDFYKLVCWNDISNTELVKLIWDTLWVETFDTQNSDSLDFKEYYSSRMREAFETIFLEANKVKQKKIPKLNRFSLKWYIWTNCTIISDQLVNWEKYERVLYHPENTRVYIWDFWWERISDWTYSYPFSQSQYNEKTKKIEMIDKNLDW